MKIVLLIRRDKDYWLNNKMSFNGVVSNLFERNVRGRSFIWNLFFKMQYLEFRRRLAEIASLSYPQNDFDDIIMYMDRDQINSLEPGTLIVPMDDDDWFSPDLVKNLREREYPSKGIYWDRYVKSLNGEIQHPHRYADEKYHNSSIASCCYSLRVPCRHSHLLGHWRVRKDNMDYISKRLSLKVDLFSGISVQFLNVKKNMALSNYKEYIIEIMLSDVESSDIFPEEYSNQGRLYKELLKELLESQI